MSQKCVLAIAGSDSGGAAGIAADLITLAACGVHGTCAITAVTAQSTLGVEHIFPVPPESVGKQIDAVVKDMNVKWAKTGMLWDRETVVLVRKKITANDLGTVVDPVTTSATGHQLIKDSAIDEILKLISISNIVTPNIAEAERLSGIKIRSISDMKNAGKELLGTGARAVLVKGGHAGGKYVTDLLCTRKEVIEFRDVKLTSEVLHGTGCSLSSAIAAGLAKGHDIKRAVIEARNFIRSAITMRTALGRGVVPINPLGEIMLMAEKGRCLEEVGRAAELLVDSGTFTVLIPEVGSNITMALPGAMYPSDVVGLSGRIIRSGKKPHLGGIPKLGGSGHMARVVLAAMKHDPDIRSGMNIRYSEDVVKVCKKMGLTVSYFDRRREPRGVNTMEWGTSEAIKKIGRVPDVIYDMGGEGKEAMIRILGKSALEVAGMALKIAERVED
ncbi:MAG: bifunctional hydroxymethylpyrimidine kinase/phosphomethylpyrimidine kinase [Candidatus Hadarchaeales archaeon]